MSFTSTQESIAKQLIESIAGSVENLTADQKRTLLDKIAVASAGDIQAADTRKKYSRVAAASQDEHMLGVIKQTARDLATIGLTLDEAIEGGVTLIDRAVKAAGNMSLEKRLEMKSALKLLQVI